MTEQQLDITKLSDLEFAKLWQAQKTLLYQAIGNDQALQIKYERRKALTPVQPKQESPSPKVQPGSSVD
jgi:hypothetical protein